MPCSVTVPCQPLEAWLKDVSFSSSCTNLFNLEDILNLYSNYEKCSSTFRFVVSDIQKRDFHIPGSPTEDAKDILSRCPLSTAIETLCQGDRRKPMNTKFTVRNIYICSRGHCMSAYR